jgi:hypothetical protein
MAKKEKIIVDSDSYEFKKYPVMGKKYQHYKGGVYEFMFVGTDEETKEDIAIYKSVHRGTIYIRKLSSWFDQITLTSKYISDRVVTRFEEIKER